MNLLDLNEKIQQYGSIDYEDTIDSDKLKSCIKALIVTDTELFINQTEDVSQYFKYNKPLAQVTPKELREEVFFSAKLGYITVGVPSRLVYAIKKCYDNKLTPNQATKTLSKMVSEELIEEGFSSKITIKDVLDNVYQYDIELVGDFSRFVLNQNIVEYYIENIDRVMVAHKDVLCKLGNIEDISNLRYDETSGVVIDKSAIGGSVVSVNSLVSKANIVLNDLDLRTVIL